MLGLPSSLELPLLSALGAIDKCIVVSNRYPGRRVGHRNVSCGPMKQETEGGRARFEWLMLGLFSTHDSNSHDNSGVKDQRSRGEI